MPYIVNDNCIKCKHLDCVEVCPVDCFHEGENMLVINPEECIDCDVCVPECPVEAIVSDSDPAAAEWLDFNRKYSIEMMWPVITENGDPDPEHKNITQIIFQMERCIYFLKNQAKEADLLPSINNCYTITRNLLSSICTSRVRVWG